MIKLKQWSISAGNNFNNVIKFGTSETLCNETVVNLENVKPISVHGEGSANKLGEIILTWLRTKLRGHPKALVTKDKKKTFYPAWLMHQGMVISLKMKDFISEMGYRGSKSLLDISKVKEQRVDGSYFGYNPKLRCILVHGKPIGDIEIKFIRFLCHYNILSVNILLILVGLGYWLLLIGLSILYLFYSTYVNFSTTSLTTNSSKGSGVSAPSPRDFSVIDHKKNHSPYYVTGLVDGEGSFGLYVTKDSSTRSGYHIQTTFQITLHKNDYALLEMVKEFFGVGVFIKMVIDILSTL